MITKTNVEFRANGITYTQRTWLEDDGTFVRGDLFIGGRLKSQYKTQAGLERSVNKIKNGK